MADARNLSSEQIGLQFRKRAGTLWRKSGTLSLLLLLFNQHQFAQSLNDTLLLPDVEVISDRWFSPSHEFGEHFDSAVLQRLQYQNLSQLLSSQSPVFVKNYGPGALSTVSMRGTSANHTLVLWNDLPINAPMLGQVDFAQLPVFFVDEAGLLWGSAATARQAGGLGGTVTLDNAIRLAKGLESEVSVQAGSFGSSAIYADLGFSKSKFQLRTRFFKQHSRNDFEYENTAMLPVKRMKQQNADFDNEGLMHEFHWLTKAGTFSLISWNQWNRRNLPPIMTNLERGGNPEEFQNDRFHRTLMVYRKDVKNLSVEARTAWFNEAQNYYLRTTSSAPDAQTVSLIDSRNGMNSFHSQLKIGLRIHAKVKAELKTLWNSERVGSNNYTEIKRRDRASWMLSLLLNPGHRISGDLLVRQDFTGNQSLGLFPAATVQYLVLPARKFTVSAGINRNYHLPGMNDLYWYPGGNDQLKAEKALTADLSLAMQPLNNEIVLDTKVNFFFSQIDDWIQWRPTTYRYWEPLNIARVLARGMEVSLTAKARLKDWKLNLQTHYMLTHTTDESTLARVENIAGKQLIYIPKHHANVVLGVLGKPVQMSYTLEITGKRNTSLNGDAMYTGQLPAYLLHHISIGKEFHSFALEASVHNLLNRSYQAVLWRAMPGRQFSFMLRAKL